MPISVKSSFDFSGYKLMLKPPACVQMLSFVKIITNISLLAMLAIFSSLSAPRGCGYPSACNIGTGYPTSSSYYQCMDFFWGKCYFFLCFNNNCQERFSMHYRLRWPFGDSEMQKKSAKVTACFSSIFNPTLLKNVCLARQ